MKTPVLETSRLTLREYRLSDFPAHNAMWADPRTTRLFGEYVHDEETCWLRFQRNWGQWPMFGYGNWVVEEKASGRHIGSLGFFNAHRNMDIPFRDAPEAGWVLSPDHHGKGFASEALTAAFAWADANIAVPQTWCMIAPQNVISQRTAAKFGFRTGPESLYKGHPVQTYLRKRGGGT